MPQKRSDEELLLPRVTQEIWDHERGLIIKQTQDVERLLEENHADRTSGNNGYSRDRSMRRIGSIPNIVVEEWFRKKGMNPLDGSPETLQEYRNILREHPFFRTVDKI